MPNLNSYIYTYIFFNEMILYFKNLTTKKTLGLDESTVEFQQKFYTILSKFFQKI